MLALKVNAAQKNYETLEALKKVNLEVEEGEFFGLLGPNGAGKTTLIHSIVGLCRLNSGTISVFGNDVFKNPLPAHQAIGFSPQDMNLDRFFTIYRILFYQAGFFGVARKKRKDIVEKLLHDFGLTEKASVPYYRLSGGMQKRLLIAKALVSSPKLLILDEPTAGVDVEQRHHLWEYLRKLNREGTTIILTTHYIDEAESLCSRIGIINLGEIKEMGSPQGLINKYCEKKVWIKTSRPLVYQQWAKPHFSIDREGDMLVGRGPNAGAMTEFFIQKMKEQPDTQVLDLHVERGTLEDVFLKLVGKKL
ncbi:MAG TPA: multidrug ABC transporter ATP-binding protein [Deltaproteobacteria bacterium]|nr:multidrug ABC transporter ATP-binding protein [Deltaproteobacteria bacterium]